MLVGLCKSFDRLIVVRSPAKLVRILALLCIAALLFAAIAAVPGLDFALLAVLMFFPIAKSLTRDQVFVDAGNAPPSPHRSTSRPRSPPVG